MKRLKLVAIAILLFLSSLGGVIAAPANVEKFIKVFPAMAAEQTGGKDVGKCEAKQVTDTDGPVYMETPEGPAPVVEASCDGLPFKCYIVFHPDPSQDLSATLGCEQKPIKQRVDTQ